MHTWGEVRNFACQKFGFTPDQDRTGLRTEILDWIGNANIFDPFNISFRSVFSTLRLSRCQAKFLTSHHVRMHRLIFYIPDTLINLII